MEALINKPVKKVEEISVNTIIPNFSYVNHLGVLVKLVKTAL
ncbi:hypothetical protein SAMN05444411_10977 [Lutibacter oricola]|uniref:Uncharacterized protein n=1 Tax=Lutibacter oricola TaxID=762486 RepID=A0A1H3EER2_9FLAO|nr:hypothetical protein [Lutibacter oricola]SDX77213.1 hypothetical protein SAMN05444411_10977 [Lutibacter oricola]